MRLRPAPALIASAAALLIAGPVAGLPSFSDLVVFGDSLVDAGNTQHALGGPGGPSCDSSLPPCDPAPASDGYFEGRFTNGPNAADILNQAIEGTPSVPSLLQGQNYAFGAARARGGAIPDLFDQVGLYLADVGSAADPNALFLINVGGNDARDQVRANDAGTAILSDQELIDGVVNTIVSQISVLQGAGAKHFLVGGVGDVGMIPETLDLGAAAVANGTQLSSDLNAALFAALAPGIYTLDVIALFDAIQLDPESFGLPAGIDVTTSCLTHGAPPACGDFAFFDPVHPSGALHQIVGDEMIAAVPEPGTAGLLVIGLVGLARLTRRRRRRSRLSARPARVRTPVAFGPPASTSRARSLQSACRKTRWAMDSSR